MVIMTNIAKPMSYSQSRTFFEGDWREGNVPIMGPRTHAAWPDPSLRGAKRRSNPGLWLSCSGLWIASLREVEDARL